MLADTSAWVEFLRATGSDTHHAFRDALVGDSVATTDVVAMELLAGARDELQAAALRSLLARCEQLPQQPWADAESAAQLYRAARRTGETPRSLIDCMIAAVAIRVGMPVLHRDRDYEVIATISGLGIAR